jgi:predicted membrane protein
MNEQRSTCDSLFSTRLLIGIWIIALGLIFLAGNLGWIDARHIVRSIWPLIFVFIGSGMVAPQRGRRANRWGWLFIVVGLWMFLDRIGWVDLDFWRIAFPLALLALGGILVWRALRGPPEEQFAPSEEHAEFVRSFAIMSGTELRPMTRPFRGADLSAVLGGINLDLSSARMEGDTAVIEVFAFWGGMEIHVPQDWTVSSRLAVLMGGFIDKRRPTSTVPTKTLVITGFVVMSGVEIKN